MPAPPHPIASSARPTAPHLDEACRACCTQGDPMTTITTGDQPRLTPHHASGTLSSAKHMLIVVDDSSESAKTLHYVGLLLRDIRDVTITLFHVLNPMPRELMEHGGSENPDTEARLSAQLRQAQEEWVRTEEALEYPILIKALEELGQTGFPLDRVSLKLGHERDVADTIIDEVHGGEYGTLVVTRYARGSGRRLFGYGMIDRLMRELPGTAVWIVG